MARRCIVCGVAVLIGVNLLTWPRLVLQWHAVSVADRTQHADVPQDVAAKLGNPRRVIHARVVEEHHEVLPAWFQLAPDLHEAVLVHFDSHPDNAVPARDPEVSRPQAGKGTGGKLRYLNKENAQRLGLQARDVFIVAAALAGLLRHFVWVFPSWDAAGPRHDGRMSYPFTFQNDPDYHFAFVGFTADGRPCMCEFPGWSIANGTELFRRITDAELAVDFGGQPECIDEADDSVAEASCQKVAPLHHIFVTERTFTAWGQVWENLISSFSGGAILDIDEDHLSVNDADKTEFHSAVGVHTAKLLQSRLEELCPNASIASERLANAALRPLFAAVDKCALGSDACADMDEAAEKTWGMLAPMWCGSGETRRTWIDQFVKNLQQIAQRRKEALSTLGRYGLCMRTSPKSTLVGVGNSVDAVKANRHAIELCGHKLCWPCGIERDTTHDEDVVARQEDGATLMLRLETLSEAFLQIPPNATRVVTVARSIRDGFTPKRQWQLIEDGIVAGLRQWAASGRSGIASGTTGGEETLELSLRYDGDLLGGPGGWVQHSGLSAAVLAAAAQASADLAVAELTSDQ